MRPRLLRQGIGLILWMGQQPGSLGGGAYTGRMAASTVFFQVWRLLIARGLLESLADVECHVTMVLEAYR